MQISTTSYMQNSVLAHKNTTSIQENKPSFDTFLSLHNSDTSKAQEVQEESKTLSKILGLDLDMNVMIFVSVYQAASLEAESLYGNYKNGNSSEDIAHNQKVADKAHEIWYQWMNETDINKIQKILELSLNALKNHTHNNRFRLDEFGNLSSLPQHIFEAEKSKAIDILSEILQGVKA